MATETLPASRDREEQNIIPNQRRDTVVIVGAGQNTKHMGKSVARLAEDHPVHVFEVGEPLIPVDPDRLHMTNTEEGRRSAAQLLGSGAVHATYLSVVPSLHARILEEHLEYAGQGLIDYVVLPKPFAQNVKEMRYMRDLLRAAEARRKELDPSYDPKKDPLLFIHEHYIEKGAWHALREKLSQIVEILGYLKSFDINIQEARTPEDEGRELAFQGGALEDLAPHTISLSRDVQLAINNSSRYTIPDQSTTSIERFRHEGSSLPEGVETSFIVHGQNTIIDTERNEQHDVAFTWRGGKGLVDKKDAVLTFVHPDTGEESIIMVDLSANALVVPRAICHLFPVTRFDENGYGYCYFEDNGYGRSVETGLNGGDPRRSFQLVDEAFVVTKWQHVLRNQCKDIPPQIHQKGAELHDLTGE